MTLGRAPVQGSLVQPANVRYVDERLSPTSIFRLLHDDCHRLFPDGAFADLFREVGRASVPPRIVAVVMVLQRFEGLSDREAVDRFTFDLRWKYAAGGLDLEYPGFVHTVLVDMRARLGKSEKPTRIFDSVLDVAKAAGMVGRRRVLDSTPLYDAVATQDTVTMIRSSIRALLRVADLALASELRAVLKRDDDYAAAGKPACDWDDKDAREALVDALARDAYAVLGVLDDRSLEDDVKEAAALVATVVGQDLEPAEDGRFRIARRVAPDRVISTVDPEARHGHKTSAHGYDGFKGHLAIDPDSEIITAAAVTAANVGDGSVAKELLPEIAPEAQQDGTVQPGQEATPPAITEVFGDASYGTAEVLKHLDAAGVDANVKVQRAPPPHEGFFTQDDFVIDTAARTARCPQGVLVQLRVRKDGGAFGTFAPHCNDCPLRAKCTTSKTGRNINVHPEHDRIHRARLHQQGEAWRRNYRATRPKVERKLAHLMRRRHGGRRARMRGRERVAQDFLMLCAAVNLNRLAQLRAKPTPSATVPAA
jgi:hypothetical protein